MPENLNFRSFFFFPPSALCGAGTLIYVISLHQSETTFLPGYSCSVDDLLSLILYPSREAQKQRCLEHSLSHFSIPPSSSKDTEEKRPALKTQDPSKSFVKEAITCQHSSQPCLISWQYCSDRLSPRDNGDKPLNISMVRKRAWALTSERQGFRSYSFQHQALWGPAVPASLPMKRFLAYETSSAKTWKVPDDVA